MKSKEQRIKSLESRVTDLYSIIDTLCDRVTVIEQARSSRDMYRKLLRSIEEVQATAIRLGVTEIIDKDRLQQIKRNAERNAKD